MAERTQIWNSGGGVQSTAIAALIITGLLPKPDLAVIADTGREMSTTWEYMDRWTAPALREVGVILHRVPKSRYATVDLYGGKDKNTLLIPAYTTQGGEVGKLSTFCSNEWKRDIVRRWATREYGVTAATNWLGISADELRRAGKLSKGKWQVRYPLIELKRNRGDCYGIVQRMGWPEPPRSSCWMCPNHREDEWQWQRENAPVDFRRAIQFGKYIQKRDPHVWLHQECKPLDQVDFDPKNEVLFGGCDSGHCFT